MTANFEDYGAYLKSKEYADGLKALLGHTPVDPRDDWPIDKAELIERHSEIGRMALDWAVLNFRKANEILEAPLCPPHSQPGLRLRGCCDE